MNDSFNKEEQCSLASIYFPEMKIDYPDGLIVGFNFEGFLFVVTTIIPRDKVPTLDAIQNLSNLL